MSNLQSKIGIIESQFKKSRETSAELSERLSAISKATELFVAAKPRMLLNNNKCKVKTVDGVHIMYLDVDIINKGSYPVRVQLSPELASDREIDIHQGSKIHFRKNRKCKI